MRKDLITLAALSLVLMFSSFGYAVSDDFSSYPVGTFALNGTNGSWDNFGSASASISTSYASGSYSTKGMQSTGRPLWDETMDADNNIIRVHLNILSIPTSGMCSFQLRGDSGGGNYAAASYFSTAGR